MRLRESVKVRNLINFDRVRVYQRWRLPAIGHPPTPLLCLPADKPLRVVAYVVYPAHSLPRYVLRRNLP